MFVYYVLCLFIILCVTTVSLSSNTALVLCFLIWFSFYNFDKHIGREVKKIDINYARLSFCRELNILVEDLENESLNNLMNNLLDVEQRIIDLDYNIEHKKYVDITFNNPYYRPKRSLKSLLCKYGFSNELYNLKLEKDNIKNELLMLVKLLGINRENNILTNRFTGIFI